MGTLPLNVRDGWKANLRPLCWPDDRTAQIRDETGPQVAGFCVCIVAGPADGALPVRLFTVPDGLPLSDSQHRGCVGDLRPLLCPSLGTGNSRLGARATS